MSSSMAFGDAIAANLPALLGRANAIAPNRVQGGERGEDPGAGSRQRQLARTGIRKLAWLWAAGKRGECVAWWLWFVRTSESARSDRTARLIHLISLPREERIELLSHADGPDAAGALSAGVVRVAAVRALFDDAAETPSGGSWLDELVKTADGAAAALERDECAARIVRAVRKAARKAKAA